MRGVPRVEVDPREGGEREHQDRAPAPGRPTRARRCRSGAPGSARGPAPATVRRKVMRPRRPGGSWPARVPGSASSERRLSTYAAPPTRVTTAIAASVRSAAVGRPRFHGHPRGPTDAGGQRDRPELPEPEDAPYGRAQAAGQPQAGRGGRPPSGPPPIAASRPGPSTDALTTIIATAPITAEPREAMAGVRLSPIA